MSSIVSIFLRVSWKRAYITYRQQSFKWSLSIIVQICGKNLYFLVCLAICYQPTLIAWQLYLVGSAIWSIFTVRRYAKHDTCRRRVSVRSSVCLCVSVTLRYCTKTAKRRITQVKPHDRSVTLSFQMGCFVVAEFLLTSASLCHSRATCDTTPECDRHTHTRTQTDRQTDRQTHDDGIYRASIASRGKN